MRLKLVITALSLACALAFAACGEENAGGPGARPAAPGGGGGAAAPANPDAATGPMPDDAFKAKLTVAAPPARLAPGEQATLNVKVRNASTVQWPVSGRPGDGFFQVNLGDHWQDSAGKEAKIDDRIAMPRSLDRGEEVEIQLPVKAPDKAGDYVLEIDMVQEGVAWFAQKGSEPLKLNIKVGK